MHGAFLELKSGKMSKSGGKIWTISDLEKKGFSSLDYRYYCLLTSYRKRMIFSFEGLEAAKSAYERLKIICAEIKDDQKLNEKYFEEFKEKINDDLNMPEAIQVLWKLVRDEKAEGKYKTIKKMDEIFGLKLLEKDEIKIPQEIQNLLKERKTARENKNFEKSDKLRNKIKKLGFEIKDTKEGVEVKKL
jgi:cysteinyl-tRNA synthetase